MAKLAFDNIIYHDYSPTGDKEKANKIAINLYKISHALTWKMSPDQLAHQYVLKNRNPETWEKQMAEVLPPRLPREESVIERGDHSTFWDGVEMEEPKRRHGLIQEWGTASIEYFKDRPLNTTDLAKVLFAPRLAITKLGQLQTQVGTNVVKSKTVHEELRVRGLKLINNGRLFMGIDIDKEMDIDWNSLCRPSDEELRQFAIDLRELEHNMRAQNVPSKSRKLPVKTIDKLWRAREKELDRIGQIQTNTADRAIVLWSHQQAKDQVRADREVSLLARSEIKQWETEEAQFKEEWPLKEAGNNTRTFWDGVEVEEPKHRKGLMSYWGVTILEYFKDRPLNTTDLAKVLFAPRLATTKLSQLQTYAGTSVLRSETVKNALHDKGLRIVSRDRHFTCVDIGTEPFWDISSRPSDDELREVAMIIREQELAFAALEQVQPTAQRNTHSGSGKVSKGRHAKGTWNEREAELARIENAQNRVANRAIKAWYIQQEQQESYSPRELRREIKEWQADEIAHEREVVRQQRQARERRQKAAREVARAVREVAKRSRKNQHSGTGANTPVRTRKKSTLIYEKRPINTVPAEIKPEQMILQGVNGNFNEIVQRLIAGSKIGEIADSLQINKSELHTELLPVMREFNARTPSHLIRKIIRKNLGQLPFADVDAQLPLSKKQLSVLQYLSFGGRAEHIAVAIAEKKPDLKEAETVIRSLMKTFGTHTEAETVYKGFVTGWLGPEDDIFIDEKEAKIRKIVENKFSVETDA